MDSLWAKPLSIPIIRSSSCDRLIWNFNRNGKYSVKSGYWLAIKNRGGTAGVNLLDPVVTEFWRHLWKLKVPPKMLHFLWRCSNGFIPCMEVLYQKRIAQEATCPRCQRSNESPLHATWECRECVVVLEGARFYSKLISRQVSSFAMLIEHAMAVLTVDEMKLFVVLLWLNWKERNAVVHGDSPKAPAVLYDVGVQVWRGILGVQSVNAERNATQTSCTRRGSGTWCPPPLGWLKLNCDGSVSSNQEQVGVGVIIRTASGGFVGVVGQRLTLKLDPHDCELFAIMVGLEFVQQQGWRHVIVETDCLEAANVVNGGEVCYAAAGVIVDKIRSLMAMLNISKIIHTPREANMAAHTIVKFVALENGRLIWLGDGPSWLVNVMNFDIPVTIVPNREVS